MCHTITPSLGRVCVSVCAVCLELFDLNKLCHCFVRPLSPKQHIMSFLQGLSFLSVRLCAYPSTLCACLLICVHEEVHAMCCVEYESVT